jgi:Crp-like helix-turn-helix domain
MKLETLVEISLGIGVAEFKQMAASYLGRWDLVQLRCANFMSCSLEERLALILLELSATFGVPDPNGVRLTLSTRQQDLAELVGASRPRITEQLIVFEQRHLISRNGHQLVINQDRLQAFLSET